MVLAGQESFRVKRRAVDKRKKANEVIKLISIFTDRRREDQDGKTQKVEKQD